MILHAAAVGPNATLTGVQPIAVVWRTTRHSPLMPSYLSLAIAIVAEVFATTALKASEGFSRFLPSAFVVIGYGVSFYFLAVTLKTIPVGIVYAIWSGVGIVLISALGWVIYGQQLDWAALAGMALIIAGVLVINLFSGAVGA